MPVLTLTLSQFRSYDALDLDLAGGSLWIHGPNGAGKTNLLEALSTLGPGRGLRGAAFSDLGRRMPGEATPRPWAVSVTVGEHDDPSPAHVGTGADLRDPSRRLIRINAAATTPGGLLDHVRLVWLTPAQDRLFLDGRADRLKFFDRLVFSLTPKHASVLSAYERALRERLRLLTEGPADPAWLDGLEARLVQSGAEIIRNRRETLTGLRAEIEARETAFPRALIGLQDASVPDEDNNGLEAHLGAGFRQARSRDAATGRSLYGPHRTELSVIHLTKARQAAHCSTGEQKALILNLILAQAARLARQHDAPKPLILLDEVAAHLDVDRRRALFDETLGLGLQTLMTGTDAALFDGLKGRARGLHLDASQPVAFID